MTTTDAPTASIDPTLAVAERQLVMLTELAALAMNVSRTFAAAAEAASFQKVTRAPRLTMILEKSTAEWVRNLRLGIVRPRKNAGGDAGAPAVRARGPKERDRDRCEFDKERLDVERPDRLPRGPFRETVEALCADVGATVDWPRWKVKATKVGFSGAEPLQRPDLPAAPEPEAALPP
jgi:hypothetical protein